MKNKPFLITALLIVFILFTNCNQQNKSERETEIDFSTLSGPYLGQKPPGLTPEIFAPGIISTGYEEFKIVFSPDGKELYYQLWGAPFPVILEMKEKNGLWTKPKIASFSGQIIEGYDISPNGRKMFITSHKPVDNERWPGEKPQLWVTEKINDKWGNPKPLKASIYGYPTVAKSGNLYLATGDIWVSKYINGEYSEMKKLGDSINTEEFYEEDPFIAPDESYLMFCRNSGLSSWDIFISFKKKDGSWTKAKNMGSPINSDKSDVYPFVTSDGKYFFFSSRRSIHKDYSEKPLSYTEKMKILNSPGNGSQDIYWVSAKLIENFKPKHIQ